MLHQVFHSNERLARFMAFRCHHWPSYRKQETVCVSLKFTNPGSRDLQLSIRSGHLGSKGHPSRGTEDENESPDIAGNFLLPAWCGALARGGIGWQSDRVAGCVGEGSAACRGPSWRTRPA